MSFTMQRALPLLAAVALALPSSVASADPEKARLDSFEFTNTLEWTGDEVQAHVKLTRGKDGHYKADVGVGSDARAGLSVPDAAVVKIFKAVREFRSFPDESFAGDGAHFYTDVKASGVLPGGKSFELARWFYDPASDKPARLQGALASAVDELSKAILAANPKPSLESFEYTNTLEWSGDEGKTHVKLVRDADGRYKADVGVDKDARSGLAVSDKAVAKLEKAIDAFRAFPDESFAGDGNHFYTDVKAVQKLPDGKTRTLERFFYDPNAKKPARLQAALADAIDEFEKAVRLENPVSKGIANALGQP